MKIMNNFKIQKEKFKETVQKLKEEFKQKGAIFISPKIEKCHNNHIQKK